MPLRISTNPRSCCLLQYALTAYTIVPSLPFPDDVLAFLNGMVDTINDVMPDGNFGVYPGYVEYVHVLISPYPTFSFLHFFLYSSSFYNSCLVLLVFFSPLIPKSEWPTRYWGANYPRLLKIKEKYDSNNVFSNPQSVGNHLVSREGAASAVRITALGEPSSGTA